MHLRETHILGTDTREWLVLSYRGASGGLDHLHGVGFTEARAGYEFVRHQPLFGGVIVTQGGLGLALVDGRWTECPPGHAYVFSSRALHAYQVAPGAHWRLHWVLYGEALARPGFMAGEAPRVVPVEATGLRHAVEGLCHERATMADGSVEEQWTRLIDHSVLRLLQRTGGDARLQELWLAVQGDLAGDWSLERLARKLGMSEENLRRWCQRHEGRSPVAQVARLRMEAAATLLRYTGEKISAIAARVGYGDAFAFSTAFRRHFGCSPRAYRSSLGTRDPI